MPPPGPEPSRTSITVAASRGRTGSLAILVLLRGRWPNGTPREGGARPPGWAGPGLPRTVVSTSRPRQSALAGPRRRDHGKGSADLDDHLHFDRDVQRQGGDPDRAAGVHAGLAEHLADQLAGAVDHLRLAGERRVAGDEPDELDHPAHRGQLADLGLDRGDPVQRADP